MKQFEDLHLTQNQYQALIELRDKLFNEYSVKDLILYGSVARGEADEESDVDLLIVTSQPLTRFARHEITDTVFEVNLHYDTNFSTLVVDQKFWESGTISVLPLRDEMLREDIRL